jgi:hypothetical protein
MAPRQLFSRIETAGGEDVIEIKSTPYPEAGCQPGSRDDLGVREIEAGDTPSASPDEVGREVLVPNGGYGWVCVACIFFVNSHTWGINSVSGNITCWRSRISSPSILLRGGLYQSPCSRCQFGTYSRSLSTPIRVSFPYALHNDRPLTIIC